MATDKKPVTAYLSDELIDHLTEYCVSKKLTRDYKNGQNKPQLGTAIVDILESFFEIHNESLSMNSNITIRVNKQLKDDFIALAKHNETTATALFHKGMRDYLKDNSIPYPTTTEITNEKVIEKIQRFETELRELKALLNE